MRHVNTMKKQFKTTQISSQGATKQHRNGIENIGEYEEFKGDNKVSIKKIKVQTVSYKKGLDGLDMSQTTGSLSSILDQ